VATHQLLLMLVGVPDALMARVHASDAVMGKGAVHRRRWVVLHAPDGVEEALVVGWRGGRGRLMGVRNCC
jgi:hypothetical protein